MTSTVWRFEITLLERRSKRTIIEGIAHKEGRTYYDELFFYIVIGPGYIKLDTMRDFDGERLIEHFRRFFGDPKEAPRIEVGGRMDEEKSAFLVVDWDFPKEQMNHCIQTLNECLAQEVLPAE